MSLRLDKPPFPGAAGDDAAAGATAAVTPDGGASGSLNDVYCRLRAAILDGEMPGGTVINQVHLARRMGMSRTPIREALRMLQAEGLIESQYQQRMRVATVTPEEIDAIYATWIMVQSLSVALTVPRLTKSELAAIRAVSGQMNAPAGPTDWEVLHRRFHDLLVMHAGPILTAYIASCWDRSERVRRTRARTEALSWRVSEDDHAAIIEVYAEGSVDKAMHQMSRHLARTALAAISYLEPDYEPRAIRHALSLTTRAPTAVAAPGLF